MKEYKINKKEFMKIDINEHNKINEFCEEEKRKACLHYEIEEFKEMFRSGTILNNPYKYRLRQIFNKSIDECSLYELICLGFNSVNFHNSDFKQQ